MLLYTIKEDGTFKSVEEVQLDYIERVLWLNDGDVLRTAKQIGVGKSNIYRLIKSEKIKTK